MDSPLRDHSTSAKSREARPQRYIAYYRVSTGRQEYGLSLDAQREAVRICVAERHGRLVGEFGETMSGRKNERPQLNKALWLCGILRATLVISRLDRLSRNVGMISRLMDTGVDFLVVDFPFANKFTLHILAAIAEYESRIISERMKAILAVVRERGSRSLIPKNPHPRFPPGCQAKSARVRRARSDARARDIAPLLWASLREGKSYHVIASEFNESGVRPPRDKPWTKNSVCRIAKQTCDDFGAVKKAAMRAGLAQIKVQKRLADVGALLTDLMAQGLSYEAIAAELLRQGHQAPWGGPWGPASLRRYMMLATKEPEPLETAEARP